MQSVNGGKWEMSKLNAGRIDEIFKDCLFRSDEVVDGKPSIEPLKGEGIISNFGFHPIRTEGYRGQLKEILSDLPDTFKESVGGGMSFLNACMDKDGHQWGEHRNMEQLFALGKSLGLVSYPMPREMWSVLPGGMPYVTVKV